MLFVSDIKIRKTYSIKMRYYNFKKKKIKPFIKLNKIGHQNKLFKQNFYLWFFMVNIVNKNKRKKNVRL